MLTSVIAYSTHKYILCTNEWCSIILWYHLKDLHHSWPQIITLKATIATHLLSKLAKNGWKQVIDDTYFHNLLFYTQICLMGQLVVFSYPVVSLKVPTTLVTLNYYPMSHHSHSFKVKKLAKLAENGWKKFFDDTSKTSYSTHKYVLWANKWCSIILRYHPICLLHSQPHIVSLWATIAIQLW
jgi:hypothetical protein